MESITIQQDTYLAFFCSNRYTLCQEHDTAYKERGMESESRKQQPVDETRQQGEEEQAEKPASEGEPVDTVDTGVRAVSQPIYEFPSESQFAQAQESQLAPPEASLQGVPLEEAIRRGLIYPPPPSFYQNMPEQQRPPLPPAWKQSAAPYSYQSGTQTMTPRFAPPQPGASSVPPAQKQSRKWVWFVVAFFSLIILLSCGLCSWGFYSIFNSSMQLTSGIFSTVNNYYGSIEHQNYNAAYSDLAPQGVISGLTQQAFIQQAQQRDQQYGPVTSYVYGQPSYSFNASSQPDLSHMTLTVSVTRTHLSYNVLLSLQNIGGKWQITDFDRI